MGIEGWYGSVDDSIVLADGRFILSHSWESGGEMGGSRTEGRYEVKGDELVLRADSEYGWEQHGAGRGRDWTGKDAWTGHARIIHEADGIYMAFLDRPGGRITGRLKKSEG